MRDEQLRALEAVLEERLNATFVRVSRIRWIEEVDDEGEVVHIPVRDYVGMGEDAMVGVTWPAADERGKYKTTMIITLALLDDVGPAKLADMLAPDLEYSYAVRFASDDEQD